MKASIIVSDMDNQGMLLSNMQALCTQNFPHDQYEVILPDLGNFRAEDKAILMELEKQHPNFIVLREQGSRTQLLNRAAKQAKGELFLFIESHIWVPDTWVKQYVELFSDPSIRIVQGKIRTVPTDSWVGESQDAFFTEVMRRFKLYGSSGSYFDFHNSAMRKTLFEELGGFRDDLPAFGEFELGARACQKENTIYRFDQSLGWHYNDNRLFNYSRIISTQGADRTRIYLIHGEEFMKKYFPARKFIRYYSLIKTFRLPLIILFKTLAITSIIGIKLTRPLKLQRIARRLFISMAQNSLRYGILTTVKEHKKYRKQ